MKHILDKLFQPKSIALVGASDREHTVGYALMQNLIKPNYKGVVYPVNIKHRTIAGHNAYKRVDTIPHPIDLVIIATPAVTVPEVLEDCGKKQVLAVVIILQDLKKSGQRVKNSCSGLNRSASASEYASSDRTVLDSSTPASD